MINLLLIRGEKMYKSSKKNLLSIMLPIIVVQVIFVLKQEIFNFDASFYYYTITNPGFFFVYYLIIISLESIYALNFEYLITQNKFDDLVILRTGYFKYYSSKIKNVIKRTLFISLLQQISLLLIIIFIKSPLTFEVNDPTLTQMLPFSTHNTINFFVYFLLSIIGTTVYCVFLSSLIYYIKNKYLYTALSPLISITTIFIVGVFIIPFTNKLSALKNLSMYFYGLVIGNLPTVGNFSSGANRLNIFLASIVLYLLISILFYVITVKKRETEG
ncbi:hypothetical protein K0810_05230 [Erysipelothrix rhusiopathiae]|nr:hypothetical protein A2I91_02075 [Erysipelothrix rhusiopathiae]AOO68403.1 hypothetical protein BC346_01645 [Erysipelothrix rhusiopathiae]AWU42394.1 hypothetical protein DM789_07455 [Erysipelothrix rhusiopathiae]MDV7677544.1 hypothetical protein [Erysipelothrix rhusiopathiae]MDV7681826.1 hypothetical protein [Erysipelothrix rhusiopathiae]